MIACRARGEVAASVRWSMEDMVRPASKQVMEWIASGRGAQSGDP